MHRALDEESVHGVSLEHEPVKQGLRLLKQAQSSVVLFLRNEVDCGIVQLVEDQRHLILVDVQLLRVQLLETVFTNIVDGPRAVGCLALQGVDVLHRGLFFARLSAGLFYICHYCCLVQISICSYRGCILVNFLAGAVGRADFGGDGADGRRALPARLGRELILRRLVEWGARSRHILRPLQIAVSNFQMVLELVLVLVLWMSSSTLRGQLLRGLAGDAGAGRTRLDEHFIEAQTCGRLLLGSGISER